MLHVRASKPKVGLCQAASLGPFRQQSSCYNHGIGPRDGDLCIVAPKTWSLNTLNSWLPTNELFSSLSSNRNCQRGVYGRQLAVSIRLGCLLQCVPRSVEDNDQAVRITSHPLEAFRSPRLRASDSILSPHLCCRQTFPRGFAIKHCNSV